MKKRFISLFIAVCCVLSMIVVPAGTTNAAPANLSDGYNLIGTSENMNLYFHPEWQSFAIEDKRNGYIWESCITEDNPISETITSAKWRKQATQSFIFQYANVEVLKTADDKTETTFEYEKIDNALRFSKA